MIKLVQEYHIKEFTAPPGGIITTYSYLLKYLTLWFMKFVADLQLLNFGLFASRRRREKHVAHPQFISVFA
jgi:hypothetical protein